MGFLYKVQGIGYFAHASGYFAYALSLAGNMLLFNDGSGLAGTGLIENSYSVYQAPQTHTMLGPGALLKP
jgi:hypothetical protein